ncbi:MAG: aminoacyl-tRNA hydrolase [Oscillospiraceae bacterium]|nr:aminoacyl-tRNA hydrolase [Oscillospiraceae bacterium]
MLFSSRSVSWLVVFLGNPGLRYEGTRHNAGFMTADAFARKHDLSINRSRFQALTATCTLGGETVLLMKPQTYMNLSGEAVGQAARFYKIPADHVLVVSDDISLPIGALRIRTKGSAGGHNGLKNIISVLGTEEFPRIRLGVGAPPHPDYEMVDWVLSVFRDQDAVDMAEAAGRAADAVECLITRGPEKAMNLYSQKKVARKE